MVTRRFRRPRLAAVTAASLVVGTTLAAGFLATGGVASAATGCQVTYTANSWQGGFTASIKITAGEAHHGWTLTWTWPSGQQVTSAWSSTVTQSGADVTAKNASWNGEIAANGSVDFGVQGSWSSANTAPTSFALDGANCTGVGTGSSSGPSSSSSSSSSASSSSSSSTSSSRSSSSASSSGSSSSGTGGGCGSAAFCDGFESQSGGAPSGSWSVVTPDCSGSGTATIDTAVAHSGSKSLRINGGQGYCNHVFVKASPDLSTVGRNVYVRFWVRHTVALPPDHVAFVSMPDSADNNKALRMGGQNSKLQWNRESDDATLPAQSPAGVAQSADLPTGSWQCLEFNVNGSDGTLRTWLNGNAVAGLTEDGVPTQDIDNQWLSRSGWRPSLTALRIGWESYGNGTDTLWFDDVAFGTGRIGC